MKTQAGTEPTKHTPGPWTASLAYGGGTAIWIAPQDGAKMVLQGAQCVRSDTIQYEQISVDQLDANATLMAAAPELLTMAQHCLYLIERGFEITPAGLADLRAAIAKATGGAA